MDLEQIDTTLSDVKSRWDHGEAPYNADMLALIRAAEEMRTYITSIHGADLADPMPVFVLKAKDLRAFAAFRAYRAECSAHSLVGMAGQVARAEDEWLAWQDRNADKLGQPDHEHVSAGDALLSLGE